jgi:xylan 1,4-beta-xylosidase
LGSQELHNSDAESWLTRDGANFAGLIWNYTVPDQKESNRPFFRKVQPAAALAPVDLTVKSLTPGRYRLTVHRTGYQANDAYSQYIAWGLPKDLTPSQIAELQKLSSDASETDVTVQVGADGIFRREFPLRTNDVVAVRIDRLP